MTTTTASASRTSSAVSSTKEGGGSRRQVGFSDPDLGAECDETLGDHHPWGSRMSPVFRL